MDSIRAELFSLRRRRSTWVIGALWILMSLLFGIGIPLIVHAAIGGHPSATVSDPESLIRGTLPAHVLATTAGLYPTYGSALMLILGAVVFGADFRGRTWTTLFTSQPRRPRVVLARFAALGVAVLVVVVADCAAMLLASEIVALSTERPAAAPGVNLILQTIGFTLLVSVVGCSLGAVLATVFQGVAGAIAVGLLWFLAIENLFSGLSGSVSAVREARAFFPSGSAGSLASYFNRVTGTSDALPGVAHLSGPALSLLVLATYAVVAVAATSALLRTRDVA